MMPAFAGLILGAARRSLVLMAGGTQMGAILAIVKALDQTILQNIAIGTTRWLISDRSADLKGIVSQIADVPIMAADLDFTRSKFNGLRVYEEGFVKEGVGAGGASIAAMAKSRGLISKEVLLEEIERNYERLVMLRRS
jgi:NaMN:DMB phosphoribosyltransferase